MSASDGREAWDKLGTEDPLWAVLMEPGKKGGGWDPMEFLATGRGEVDRSLSRLAPLGLSPGTACVLDFGSGAGRLSQALSRHFDRVVAVDVSAPMLEEAKRLDRTDGRVAYVLNIVENLSFQPDCSVDVVYSSLVMQHLTRAAASRFLREFVRVLRPGGVAIVQVLDKPSLSFKGLVFRFAPFRLIAWGQTHLLGYPAPMRMTQMRRPFMESALNGSGASIVDVCADDTYGGHWTYHRYYVLRH